MNPAAYVAPAPIIPSHVSPYQARAALLQVGLLDQVEALMASEAASPQAKLAWQWATEFQRDSAFINSLGAALDLTSLQIDGLFIAASKI